MTKEEQNQIIKDTWVKNLRAEKDLPESIGDTYAAWLQGKIKQANEQLTSVENANNKQQGSAPQQSQPQAQNTGDVNGQNS